MRILIAEDDRETAEFIRRGLDELGHNVLVAGDGTEALHLLLLEDLDLAVVDRMLPRLDGLSVVRRARVAEVETPVLLLTALGRIEDRVEGLDAGADDYPHDLRTPLSRLRTRLENANRHTPPGTVIRLTVVTANGLAFFAVVDSGPGVPKVDLPRITKRFARLESSRNTAGYGLGLSLVDAVAKLHGGRLVLTSAAPGLSATLELPLAPDSSAPIDETGTADAKEMTE